MWVPVVVWQPCELLYTCYLLTCHYTHPFNSPFPGLPRWAGTRKVKPIWILLKQETVSGSGISWNICKSAPRSRQITTPAPHHSVFTGRMPFLPPIQQHQSTEGTYLPLTVTKLTTLKNSPFWPNLYIFYSCRVWTNASMLMLLCLQFAEEVSDLYWHRWYISCS